MQEFVSFEAPLQDNLTAGVDHRTFSALIFSLFQLNIHAFRSTQCHISQHWPGWYWPD